VVTSNQKFRDKFLCFQRACASEQTHPARKADSRNAALHRLPQKFNFDARNLSKEIS
jgi:hypothetical protein